MKITSALAAIGALASLSACVAIGPAEMARPPSLASAVATPVLGIGGGESGRFRLGDHSGAFTRSATRLSFFETVTLRDGAADFSVSGPDFPAGLAAECAMRERTITLDIVEFKPAPLAYACSFRLGGQAIAARLEIQEAAPGPTNRQERRGRAMIGETVLDIRSVHDLAGAILPVSAPVGYVFERNGLAIGGVETNGQPVMLEAAGLSPGERRAIMLAAIALSVFWDPANIEA